MITTSTSELLKFGYINQSISTHKKYLQKQIEIQINLLTMQTIFQLNNVNISTMAILNCLVHIN